MEHSNKTKMEQTLNKQLDSEQEQARFMSLAYQVKHGLMTREEALESFQEAHKKSAEAWERYMNPATYHLHGELLNIIKQLRDYIANSDIAPEDSDRLYQEHLALADSALSHCAECGEDTDDDEEIACANCGDLGLKSNFNEGITKQGPKLYCKDCLEDPTDSEDDEEED